MIVVTLLKTGGEYTPEHVYKLRDQVKKFLPEFNFVCISDVPLDCETLKIKNNWPAWWSKMEMFRIPVETLCIDLDTIILKRPVNFLTRVRGNKFCALRDVYRGRNGEYALQSSVMYWNDDTDYLYKRFLYMPEFLEGGDQIFIEKNAKDVSFIQDLTDSCVSFKCDIQRRGIKDSDEIVFFHGEPRPWRQNVIQY